jgi:hypothetical protein
VGYLVGKRVGLLTKVVGEAVLGARVGLLGLAVVITVGFRDGATVGRTVGL